MRLSLLRQTPGLGGGGGGGGGGIGRDLTFIKANRPWLGVNNRSNVFATWFDKRSNAYACLVMIFTRQIPTSPQGVGGGVSRNSGRRIIICMLMYECV